MATPPSSSLLGLIQQLEKTDDLASRNLWLHDAVQWIRGDGSHVPDAVARVALLVDALLARPALAAAFRRWWHATRSELDATPLLSDLGFAPRTSFASELGRRLRLKTLPATPETANWEVLFHFLQPQPFDARWLHSLDEQTLHGLERLMDSPGHSPMLDAQLLDALTCCIGQIHAFGCASEIRMRMVNPQADAQPFHALQGLLDDFRHSLQRNEDAIASAQALRQGLDTCRHAASGIYTHLENNGISVGIVFRLRQLRERVIRCKLLIDTLLAPSPMPALCHLLAHLAQAAHNTRSLRALWRSNTHLLAAKITERSAESGEHYITRNMAEFRDMLGKAFGGGSIIGLTTWAKFGLYGLALSPFWNGLAAGLNYAIAFVAIMLLHWTVATKQPAVTAPAMASKLKHLDDDSHVEGFVDEVAHLYRSQVAAIVGNLAAVVPVVVLICLALVSSGQADMLSPEQARHVLHDMHLLGPTAIFAAFTGVLLFISSLIAGWVENAFVLHQLESALRYHRGLWRLFGQGMAWRLSQFMRRHISGLSANISLGLLLGITPALAQFFGLHLEVRHVTLSAGQVAAAVHALGWSSLQTPEFWWAVAGVLLIGPLNLGVSFYLAFRLALAAQDVQAPQRGRIGRALRQRLRHAPRDFVWPPRAPTQPPAGTP
jgi:site-specific recombinase